MKNASVLVVDDEPAWQEICAMFLSRLGYTVQVAGSFHEAMSKLLANDYDVAVLDWFLDYQVASPGGLDVLRWLVNNKISTKVIFLTGSTDSVSLASAISPYAANVMCVFQKADLPNVFEELAACIAASLPDTKLDRTCF